MLQPLFTSRRNLLLPTGQTSVLAVATGLVVALAIMAPMQSWVVVIFAIVAPLIGSPKAATALHGVLAPNAATVAALAFSMWAMASAGWALDPRGALVVSAVLLAVVLATHLACHLSAVLDQQALRAVGVALVAAQLIVGAVLAIDSSTHQLLSILLFNTFEALRGHGDHIVMQGGSVVLIDNVVINRPICVWMLFLWPAMAFVRTLLNGGARHLSIAVLLIEAFVIAATTTHKSSALALGVSALVGAIWMVSERKVFLGVCAAWCAACLFVVPIVGFAYDSGLSHNPRLFHSARERVAIWSYTAHHVGDHPLVGLGANASRVIYDDFWAKGDQPADPYNASRPGFHSHNFYLQVWYELGAIGALAFLATGLAGLMLAWRVGPTARRLLVTELVAIAAMIATNYGLWQFWFQAAMAGALVLSVIWLRLYNMRDDKLLKETY